MEFALIGGGVVGRAYGKALVESGASLAGILDVVPTEDLRALATEAGASVHAAPGAWLANSDFVLSAVFGTAALDVAMRSLPCMRPGSVYVDMTTARPEDMVTAAAAAAKRHVGFVDVAITGAVNLQGARTPLLCAGEDAREVSALFARLGAPVKVVGSHAGDASRLKLLRSIFAKGLEALTIECLTTAAVDGLRAPLHEVLLDLDQMPLQALMETLVVTHVEHAARRRDEVIEAQHLMRANGIEPVVLPAVQALFERTVTALERNTAPGRDPDEILHWLVASTSTATKTRGAGEHPALATAAATPGGTPP